jgi:predicted phosphoribosyltransferase
MFLRAELFQDRRDAGRVLGHAILAAGIWRGGQDGIVLGLPRGGVPVAYEVALALHLPLDVVVVRKLGVPGFAELAMGAVAADGVVALNAAIIHEFRIPDEIVDAAAKQESQEVERRERAYRNGRSPEPTEGRLAILVDDGLATGASMLAAVRAVRPRAREVVVAVPVAAQSTCNDLRHEADHVICARSPWPFYSVGSFYRNFEQTTDAEVCSLLSNASANNDRLTGALSEVVKS